MNLIGIDELDKGQISEIFSFSDKFRRGSLSESMRGKKLSLFFEKPSTRTRVSFESAMFDLGGSSIYLDSHNLQLSRGETYADTAKTLSSYVDIIAARMYKHTDLKTLANNSSVPVINALTDMEHPCQALSDFYTIQRQTDSEPGSVKLAFIGDTDSNMAHSLALAGSMLGYNVCLVGPKQARPNSHYLSAAPGGSRIEFQTDIRKGLKDADFVYTDTYVSMGQESEAEKRKKLFAPYQLNARIMSFAKKDAMAMHCLPAHRGEEITREVIDSERSLIWEQVKNKKIVEGGILAYLLTHN